MTRQTDTPTIAAAYAHRRACRTALEAARASIASSLTQTSASCARTRQIVSQVAPVPVGPDDLWVEIETHLAETMRMLRARSARHGTP